MGKDKSARLGARRRVIAGLLAGAAAPEEDDSPEEEARARVRRLRRLEWAMRRIDDLVRAQKAADAAWSALVAPYDDLGEDEEMPELEPPPEQAEVEAILAEIHAVTEEDRWPAHLHWSL